MKKRIESNKIKHVQNINATELRVNPIVDTSISNYGIDWWHCTIYIMITVTGISRRLTKKL